MRKPFLFLLLSCGLLGACRFNDPETRSGIDWLQGEWEEEKNPAAETLISYAQSRYRFACDSVFVTMSMNNRADTSSKNCSEKGSWKEYASGNYYLIGDTLRIKGYFTQADFTLKNGGCHRTGVFEENLLLQGRSPDSLHTVNLQTAIEAVLLRRSNKSCGE
ncbi:MAG: hypothetical protein INR69_10690 [Mucilaginibacter polytrichastri]|nr:hypothetical protein [Mucilaginibacter polytrichastri]